MPSALQSALEGQFGAAIEMLENAIGSCPESLWAESGGQPAFWYVVYHTLFFLDYYLSDTDRGFAPPGPFDLAELNPVGVMPPRVYSKSELQGYLEHGRDKCRSAIAVLTDARAEESCGFARFSMSRAELMLDNLRHVQHHTAQLNLLLRQRTDSAPAWVTRARRPLAAPPGR